MQLLISTRTALLMAALSVTTLAPLAHADAYAYDTLGRLRRVDYAAGGSTTYAYDANGNLLSVVSAGTVDVAPSPKEPLYFALREVVPHPVRRTATIRFDLPARAPTRLVLFDVAGREIARLVNGEIDAGEHVVRIDAVGLPPGLLFARLTAGGRTAMRRLVVLR